MSGYSIFNFDESTFRKCTQNSRKRTKEKEIERNTCMSLATLRVQKRTHLFYFHYTIPLIGIPARIFRWLHTGMCVCVVWSVGKQLLEEKTFFFNLDEEPTKINGNFNNWVSFDICLNARCRILPGTHVNWTFSFGFNN